MSLISCQLNCELSGAYAVKPADQSAVKPTHSQMVCRLLLLAKLSAVHDELFPEDKSEPRASIDSHVVVLVLRSERADGRAQKAACNSAIDCPGMKRAEHQ